jgi:hypothetical protein
VLHGAYLTQITEGLAPGKAAAIAMGKLDGYCEAAEIVGFSMTPFSFKLALLEAVRKVGPLKVAITGSIVAAQNERQKWGEKILASFFVVA